MNHRLDMLPFEPVTCSKQTSSVFQNSIKIGETEMSPALVTCIIYACLTSLVTPFAGFFASGLKRAYALKDFSNAFPGHGGYLDRYDCWIFANCFMYGLLTRGLYKDDLAMDDLQTRFTELAQGQ